MDYTLLEIWKLFFVYSFLGWCCEVVFAAVNSGKFVNRGFMNGPLCPIYGYGLLAVVVLLEPYKDNFFLLLVGSGLLTTAVEFLVGFLSEKLLKVRLWDYSKRPFNIGGYVCLQFALVWGLACVLVVDIVHPMLRALVAGLPRALSLALLAVFSAMFAADLVITLVYALKLPKRLRAIEEMRGQLRSVSDNIGEGLYHGTVAVQEAGSRLREQVDEKLSEQDIRERIAALESQRNAVHDRLIAAFPALSEGRHSEIVARIKQLRQERRGK